MSALNIRFLHNNARGDVTKSSEANDKKFTSANTLKQDILLFICGRHPELVKFKQ